MKKRMIMLLCLLCLLLSYSLPGYTQTATATTNSITIPMTDWNALKADFQILNQELTTYKKEIERIKKPSAELLKELEEAEKRLKSLQEELTKQKEDLILLSSEVNELKTLSETLKKQIDKERRVHKRQVWQNRIWCLLIGVGIGCAVK